MKKKWKTLLALCMGVLLVACGAGEKEKSTGVRATGEAVYESAEVSDATLEKESIAITEETEAEPDSSAYGGKQTMLVYMVGSNLESQAAMATLDIVEMIESGFDPEKVDILLCTGGASEWWIEGIPNDACTVFQVTGDGLMPLYTMEQENMGQKETLTEFLDYGYENSETDSYSLVLWDHGGGAVLGFGSDENFEYDSLTLEELDNALAESKISEVGEKFEWIGFDACLMGMLEVADMMSDYSKYLIASEEIEAGSGWDYSFLGNLSSNAGEQTGKCIIDAYADFSRKMSIYDVDYTLSCMELSKTTEVVEKLEDFVSAADEELKGQGYSKLARKRYESKTFGRINEDSFYDTVDLYDLSKKMEEFYPQEAAKLQESIEDFVVYEKTNIPYAHGVAIYFPYENKVYANEWIDIYEDMGFSEKYTVFLEDFTAVLSGEVLSQWDVAEVAPIEDAENAGEYYVQLTKEQATNYGSAYCSIWAEDSEGSYICWLNGQNVSLSEDGKLSTDFEGKLFFLKDSSGEELPCCAYEIERTEEYSKYSAPFLCMTPGEVGVMNLRAHFKVDEEHPEGVLVGLYELQGTDETLLAEKQQVELKEGQELYGFYFARDIVFNEDGSLAPFEEWESSSGLGKGMLFTGELSAELKEFEEDTEYCCLFRIKDTQGNSYFTNPVYIKQ